MANKTVFKIAAAIFLALALVSYYGNWQFSGDGRFAGVLALLAFFAWSWNWTYTPDGRLDYRAALSLHMLSFNVTLKPDPESEFRIKLPINLIYLLSGLMPSARVERTEDIVIEHSGLKIPARVYWPLVARDQKPPLLVYYHGGGFVMGSPKDFDPMVRAIVAATGAITVSVDYRLAPRHPYPAAVEDAWAALQWGAENTSALGANSDQILVGGDSAGGNLAAVMSLRARDENGPRLAGQILYYPATSWAADENWPGNLKCTDGYGLSTDALIGFRDAYCGHLEDRALPWLSPNLAQRFDGLPPTLLVTAGFDPLTEGAMTYEQRLREAGVPVTLAHYPEIIHGFVTVSLFKQQGDALEKTTAFMAGLK